MSELNALFRFRRILVDHACIMYVNMYSIFSKFQVNMLSIFSKFQSMCMYIHLFENVVDILENVIV